MSYTKKENPHKAGSEIKSLKKFAETMLKVGTGNSINCLIAIQDYIARQKQKNSSN